MIDTSCGLTRRGFVLGGITSGAAAMLTLAACGSKGARGVGSGSASAGDDSGTPDKTQELNLDFTDLQTMDVNDIRNSNEFLVLSQCHEGLFRNVRKDGKDTRIEAGCESYDVSDDGLTYTFHLRDNSWSDGQPVTAQQYVDSVRRLTDPANGFSYAFMAEDIKGVLEFENGQGSADGIGVKALDDKTLEITLIAPVPFFLGKLVNVCFAPIRKDLIDKNGQDMANDFKLQVYSGPFVVSDRVLDNTLTLEPNPKYWDAGNVKLKKVTYTVVPEEATKSQLLNSKQLDAVIAQTDYVEKWKKDADAGKLVYRHQAQASNTYVAYNQHTGGPSGLMNNVKVRQALSLCFDREDFNKVLYSGVNKPAYGLIPFEMHCGKKVFRDEVDEPLKALVNKYKDKERIVKLFKEGVKEVKGSDDISGIELEVLGQTNNTAAKNSLEWLAQSVQDVLGIKVKQNAQSETATFVSERNANNYDYYLMGWNGDYDDPLTFFDLFTSDSGYAKFMGGYKNDEYDQMYDSLRTEGDEDKRLETYRKMEQNLVADNAGVCPIMYQYKQVFIQPYVKELDTPMFGTDFDISRSFVSGK